TSLPDADRPAAAPAEINGSKNAYGLLFLSQSAGGKEQLELGFQSGPGPVRLPDTAALGAVVAGGGARPGRGGDAEADRAHRLFRRAAARSGNAGDRYGKVSSHELPDTPCHLGGTGFGYSAVLPEGLLRNAQQTGLDGVGIAAHAAVKHLRRSGNRGDGSG